MAGHLHLQRPVARIRGNRFRREVKRGSEDRISLRLAAFHASSNMGCAQREGSHREVGKG